MDYKEYKQAKAIEAKNKHRMLDINPQLDESSGIYFLTRVDENGIKYAYVGQAKHLLTRLAQHLVGYQHIDLSLKKHGLHSPNNPYGWKVGFLHYPESKLNEMEQVYIRSYAQNGYQLRNKTSGSQGKDKTQIDEYRPAKGYRDGIIQGRKSLAKELWHIIDKHLVVSIKPEKLHNKVSQQAYEKFMGLINPEENEDGR